MLSRSLTGLRDLISRSLDEVRLMNAVKNKKRFQVAELIDEIGAGATLEADARSLTLVVSPMQEELAIEADRQVRTAVIGNLVQNAFKFTRPHSAVNLRVRADVDRVLIEVEDECGGLPGQGEGKELPPSFEQRDANRTGLGIGLAFSRWGAEVNGGRLYARNLPGTGVRVYRRPAAVVSSGIRPSLRGANSNPCSRSRSLATRSSATPSILPTLLGGDRQPGTALLTVVGFHVAHAGGKLHWMVLADGADWLHRRRFDHSRFFLNWGWK